MKSPQADPEAFPSRTKGERLAVSACAAVVGGMALIGFVGEWLGDPRFRLETGFPWIAPSTALSILFLGAALGFMQLLGNRAVARTVVIITASVTALANTALAIRNHINPWGPWDFEKWLRRTEAQTAGIRVLHVDPVVAGVFVLLSGVLIWLTLSRSQPVRWRIRGTIVSLLLLLAGACSVSALSQASGIPLLLAGRLIPVAFSTTLALTVLSFGLAIACGLRIWMFQVVLGDAPTQSDDIRTDRQHRERRVMGEILISCALLAAAFSLYLRADLLQVRRDVNAQIVNVADLKVSQIEAWRRERLLDARALMHIPLLPEGVMALAAKPAEAAAPNGLLHFFKEYRRIYAYTAVIFFDRALEPVLTLQAGADRAEAVSRERLRDAALAHDPLFDDLHRGPDGEIFMDIFVPLRLADGDSFAGAVVLRVDARAQLFPLVEQWPTKTLSAESLLLERERQSALFLTDLRHRKDTALNLRVPLDQLSKFSAKATTQRWVDVTETIDYNDVPVLAVSRPVADSPWTLVVKIDRAAAFALLRQHLWESALIFGFVAVSVALLVGNSWERQRYSLERRQLESERARRDALARLGAVMRHANDIILLLDESLRIVEANERASEAYGYSHAELLQMTNYDLRSGERAALDKDYGDLVTSHESFVRERIHRRKDGTVFPVEVSARIVEDGGRRQVLAIIRDISERKAHELELGRLSSMYRMITHVSRALLRAKTRDELFAEICRVLVEVGGFKIAWIGLLDPAAQLLAPVAVAGDEHDYLKDLRISTDPRAPEGMGLSGRAMRDGHTQVSNDALGDPVLQPWHERAASAGFQSTIALPLRRQGQIVGLLKVYSAEKNFFGPREIMRLEETAGNVSFALDVFFVEAQHRDAEAALRGSERKFQAVFDQAAVGVVIAKGPRGDFVNVNRCFCEMMGYSAEELLQLSSHDITHRDFIAADSEKLEQISSGAVTSFSREKLYRRKDGSYMWARVFVAPLDPTEPKPTLRIGVIEDITARKEAEAQLSNAAKIAHLGSWEYIVASNRFILSDAFYAMLRTTAEQEGGYEMSSARYTERFYRPEDAAVMEKAIREATETADSHYNGQLEHRIIFADGKDGYLSTRFFIVKDQHGRTVKAFGITQDITERKLAEKELQFRNILLSTQQEASIDGILVVNDQSRILSYNRRFIEIFCVPEKLIEDRADELVLQHVKAQMADPRSFLERVRYLYEHSEETGRDELLMADGRTIDRYSAPMVTQDRQFWGRVWYFRDITERKQIEEKLLALSRIVEQAPLSIIITDLSGAIKYVNPRFCAVTGYTQEEALGKNPRILRSGKTPPEVYVELWKTITHGQAWTGELHNRRKNGDTYLENATIAPVVDKNGSVTNYVALKDDITAQKRFVAETTATIKKEHEMSEMKTRFISMTSHEFRTPMAVVMGSADLLHNHFDRLAPEKREELFSRIDSALRHMTEMLDDILLLNRAEAKRVELRLAPVDFLLLVRDLMEEVRLGDHGVHLLELHPSGDFSDFVTDSNLIRHILSNLLTNAVHYSPKGTVVTVRAQADALHVQIVVEDQGIGIPQADRARIFEPFERGSNVGSAQGTGLGLNIVKRMTEMLEGSIAVDSIEGGGSRFTVVLPRIKASETPT